MQGPRGSEPMNKRTNGREIGRASSPKVSSSRTLGPARKRSGEPSMVPRLFLPMLVAFLDFMVFVRLLFSSLICFLRVTGGNGADDRRVSRRGRDLHCYHELVEAHARRGGLTFRVPTGHMCQSGAGGVCPSCFYAASAWCKLCYGLPL